MTNAGCQMEIRRSLNVPVGVDHLVYAVPDLDVGISRIQQRSGSGRCSVAVTRITGPATP